MNFLNVIKGPITSLVGLVVICGTLYGVFIEESIPFIWNGLGGLAVGLMAFLMSDKIIEPISKAFESILKKLTNQ